MKKTSSKKSVRKEGSREDITKLKKENKKLREENRLLRSILNKESTGINGKIKGYSTRYCREI